jgi:hypothetical protein
MSLCHSGNENPVRTDSLESGRTFFRTKGGDSTRFLFYDPDPLLRHAWKGETMRYTALFAK